MNKVGAHTNEAKNKEIDNKALGLTTKGWHGQIIWQEEEKEEENWFGLVRFGFMAYQPL